MKDNLSIEEILKQAEEIRKKAEKTAKSAIEDIEATSKEFTSQTMEIPAAEISDIDKASPVKKFKQFERKLGSTRVIPNIDNNTAKSTDDKTRRVVIEEKTGVVPSLKKHKRSYFKSISTDDEPIYSRRPPEMVERPAIIKSRTSAERSSELEEMPTLVAVDELDHTKINFAPELQHSTDNSYESEESDQMVLSGFDDGIDKVEDIDESYAEELLAKKRSEKVSKFRIFSPDEFENNDNDKSKIIKNEYENHDDKTAFLEKMFASKSSITITAIITFVLGALIGLMTVFKDNAHMPQFLLNDSAFFTVLVIIYALVMLVNIKNIVHGFNFKNGINSDLPISVASLVVFAHTLMLAVSPELYIDNGTPFTFVGAFALFMSSIGKRAQISRIIDNFEFIASQEGQLYTVESIANAIDATIISRGVLTGEANLKTSIRTDFSTKFLDIACSNEPADSIAKITGLVMLAINAIAFAVFAIINNSWQYGFNLAVCGICVSLPCISLYCTNQSLRDISGKLRDNGAMINGFEGAGTVNDTNAIVIEAQNLFDKNSCEIHGKKSFNHAKPEDFVPYTAAVITQTKSPLATAFDRYIVGKDLIVPEVDSIVYEDKLGTSAWLYRKKILVGTRELLIHHSIQVPTEEFEKRHTKNGKKALYLAVAGRLMAMFVVSYSANPKLKRALRRLEKSGMTILVKSSDPYINDESIAKLFNLPEGFVRVISSSNARTFEKYSDKCVEKSPAYIIHDGSALGFVSAMEAAEGIMDIRKLLSVVISFGCAIGLGITVLLGIVDGLTQLNAINITVFQLVWCLFVRILSKLKKSI